MRVYMLLLLTLSSVFCCETAKDEENDYAFFGGEIINPNNDYVVLYDLQEQADTLYLNDQNRFILKLNDIKPGLYTFTHGGEYQRILLEPKDSIMVRLNTIDFDESLVFTGVGAKKNNYLIKLFLENESDNLQIMHLYHLEPKKYEIVLDSVRQKKTDFLNEFLDQNEYSDLFKEIAHANIDYNHYSNKELYPFGYYGYHNLIHYKDLPEGFYAFRKEVDYNNEDLNRVIPYNRFLFFHFNNIALDRYYRTATHNVVFDNESVIYNLEKLRLMDSLISNPAIKNHLLKFTARDFISVSDDSAEIQEVVDSYLKKSTNEKDKEYIQNLVTSLDKLRTGNKLPSIELLNYSHEEKDLASLISKPTIIYFWSSNLPLLLKNSHYKVNMLKKDYPEMDFIAININDEDPLHWKKTLKQYNFITSMEYQFKNPNEAMNKLAINSVKKCIFVDSNLNIINSNALLYSSELEEQIQQVLKKQKMQLLK